MDASRFGRLAGEDRGDLARSGKAGVAQHGQGVAALLPEPQTATRPLEKPAPRPVPGVRGLSHSLSDASSISI